MKPSYQLRSGLWLSLLMFMCGIGFLLRPYQVQLPILSGSSENQTSLTSGCLGALPMSISSETSENLCSLTLEKCIFVGYPSGYKGWQFYNPVTKKFIISERAIFDERSFPGLSRTSPVDLTPVGAQMNVPDALDSGGDNTFIPAAETAPIEPEFAPQPLHAPVDVPAHLQPPAAPVPPAIEPNIPNVVPDAPNAPEQFTACSTASSTCTSSSSRPSRS